MRTGVLLASHGEFAQAALASVEMIAGPQEDVYALALAADRSAEDFEQEFVQRHAELLTSCDVIVALCDIHGGTPFNTIARCMAKGMPLVAFTGLSLPVLIELLTARDTCSNADDLRALICEAQQHTLTEITVAQPETTSGTTDEDFDL